MPKRRNSPDPFADREAENYPNPIPSREYILEQLEELGEPVSHGDLAEHLELSDEDDLEGLRRRLIAMRRDGQILSNRRGMYGLSAHMGLQPGRVQGNKDGFGFFIPDEGDEDLFLSPKEMFSLFDGDRVLARETGTDQRGRKEGQVVEILERRYEQIVGRYYHEQGVGLVVPDSKRVVHEILIPEGQSRNAQDGQYVLTELVEYPSKRRKAIGKVVEVLGDISTPGLEIELAVRNHDLRDEFPAAVKKATARLPKEVNASDLKGRYDLRGIPFVTIDGEDSKDFDDAVFAEQHDDGGWTLHVAIADVSHYVEVGSELDEEARERGTSVYFPGHVIPMLPEKLSNQLCSLMPKVDRLTMVCEMEIDGDGEMTDFLFYEAVIHSHARLTYKEVADMLQEPDSSRQEKIRDKQRKRYASLLEPLEELYSLYLALRARRQADGAMDFESTETRIVFGEDRKIAEIVPVQRNHAHRLIEECMLCANVAAAELLESQKLPTLYRIHEGPNPDKLDKLRDFLGGLGLQLGGGDKPEPGHYQKVLQQLSTRPNSHLLQVMLIRSMMQAVYSPDNEGHFGLGFEAYAHFTSPIRRYPDLLVHRGIRYLLRNRRGRHLRPHDEAPRLGKADIYPYSEADMVALGEQCSTAERRADAASYEVIDWLKAEYMQDRVGDEFIATVGSVTHFGLFVELNDIYIEGLVHVTELSNDYYHFDATHHVLRGERSGVTYGLGDTVEVRVVRVDINDKKIDLQMLRKREDGGSSGGKLTGKKQSARKQGDQQQDRKQGNKKKVARKKSAKGAPGKKGSKKAARKSSKKAAAGKRATAKSGNNSTGESGKSGSGKKAARKGSGSRSRGGRSSRK